MVKCLAEKHEVIKQKIQNMNNFSNNIEKTSKIFSLLADPTRMKIVLSLMEGELCVYHICDIVGGKQSAVSQHLRKLKDGKILKCRKESNLVLYSLADLHVVNIINQAIEHISCD
ncbi:MAG: winged helix-turn-helix transcriptional regulator [Clostridia bacterium]|nr:winged helix-turn-helix transcriptional regulator [Clostridia bacterium]